MTSRKHGKAASALAMAAVLIITALAPAAAAQTRGRDRTPRNPRPPVTAPAPAPAPTPAPAPPVNHDDPDQHFVHMMIPHHHQAIVMSELAPTRSGNQSVRALASRIEAEQSVEIMMLQNWQVWNGLQVTNAPQAYQMMLGMPAMLEQMGMATPAELDALRASSGTAFDRLYLQLMIEHHEGAITMLEDVIINGSDGVLQYWATDMMTTQTIQIRQMQRMLDEMS